MKILKPLILTFVFVLISNVGQAQFWKKIKERAKEAAEETVLRKAEEKASEKTEKAIDSIFELPNKKRNKRKKRVGNTNGNTPSDEAIYKDSDEYEEGEGYEEDNTTSNENVKVWSKYNFVPGDEIIFYDDLVNEESGEFPSRWDLLKGNAENASLMEENVIHMLNGAKITPLMDEETYLPEVFTIEFDALFKSVHGPTYQDYRVNLWSGDKNYGYSEDKTYYCKSINLNVHGASMDCVDNKQNKEYASFDEAMTAAVDEPVWRHVAIAFNKRSLKVFIDESRALSIPNIKFKPEAFSVEIFAYYDELSAIKNVRIAKGGKKLYDRVLADGKFVTRGILFDVNQATIKKESYGVLNKVANMMKTHEELRFTIEGHTDSDGEAEYNLSLSAARADAVKIALQDLGVSEDRLQTEGKGETVPVSENSSPEGKANNRRVEFKRINE